MIASLGLSPRFRPARGRASWEGEEDRPGMMGPRA